MRRSKRVDFVPSRTTVGSAKIMITFRAAALQMMVYPVNFAANRDEARSMIAAAIERIGVVVAGLRLTSGGPAKLIVLPEYLLTGFPMGMSMDQWMDWAVVDATGPEYERIAAIAHANDCFLCANAYERDEHFPGTYFQSYSIFDPAGDVCLRYRRLNSLHTPTPHDYWDRYLDIYGVEGVFPVAKTEIGNLCAVASEEIQYPELVRSFAMRGAEVICHPSAEALDLAISKKDIAKRARAIESMAYVVSANIAGHKNVPFLEASADGLSKIVDYEGRVLAEAGQGETIGATADINVSSLRHFRSRPTMDNYLSRQRFEPYRLTYASPDQYPPNTLLNAAPSRERFLQNQKDVLARLVAAGVIEPSDD